MGTENGDPIRSPASEISQANTANQENKYFNVNIGALVNITDNWVVDFDFTNTNETFINNRLGTRYTALNSWGGALPLTDAEGNRIYVNDQGTPVPSTTPNALPRSEEHTSELQSRPHLVCRLLLEKK